jgi:hypothetical protein
MIVQIGVDLLSLFFFSGLVRHNQVSRLSAPPLPPFYWGFGGQAITALPGIDN